MKVLTASQMREVDLLTTERYGIPSLLLMENAGSGVVREMEANYGDLRKYKTAVFCGKGNNGGDGFVVARHLVMRGCSPQVLLFGSPAELKGDARINFEILEKMGMPIQIVLESECTDDSLKRLFQEQEADLVVDGILGTGTRMPVSGFLETVIRHMQRFPKIVAIDIPSGWNCDLQTLDDSSTNRLRVDLTITFTAPKPIHVFLPKGVFSNRWVSLPIGTPSELLEDPRFWLNYVVETEAAQVFKQFKRKPDAHKGNFGHVLIVAGSVGKSGAACMTARSCLLAGAGLATLATPSPCLPMVAGQMLEVMTEPLDSTDSGGVSTKAFDYGRINRILEGKDLIALGPGLGMHQETVEFVRRLVADTSLPIVLDADGVNAFVGKLELLQGKNRILALTPHPGEFARLLGIPASEVLLKRVELARQFALEKQVHLVLKGHRTIYAAPSGQVYVNSTGNPGMATGGSGDVLTGVLAGLLGQGLFLERSEGLREFTRTEQWISLAVFVHGLAGDMAVATQGENALLATDISANLPKAFLHLVRVACF